MSNKSKNKKPSMIASAVGPQIEDFASFRRAIELASEQSIGNAESTLKRISDIFDETDPEGIVAILCTYGSIQVDRGEDSSVSSILKGVEQHHMELLLELYANYGHRGTATKPVTPHVIAEVIEILTSLGSTFLSFRIRSGLKTGQADKSKHKLLERARMHTQAVRNWAYFDGIERTLSGLFGADDKPFEEHHGFYARNVLQVFQCLMSHAENAIAGRMKVLSTVAKGRKPLEVFRRYFRAIPTLEGSPEAMMSLLGRDIDRSDALGMVMGHYDLHLPYQIAITPIEIATQTGLQVAIVNKIIEKFSIN